MKKAQVNSNFTLPTRTNPTDSPTPPSGASSKMNKEQFGWVLISEVSTNFNPEYEIYTRYKTGDTEKEGLSSPISVE